MLEGKRFGLQQKCHAESSDVPLRLWSQCWTHQKIQCSPLPDEQMESSISGGRVKALGFEAVATASDQHLSAPHTRCALRLLVGRARRSALKQKIGQTGRPDGRNRNPAKHEHTRAIATDHGRTVMVRRGSGFIGSIAKVKILLTKCFCVKHQHQRDRRLDSTRLTHSKAGSFSLLLECDKVALVYEI